MKIIYTYIHIHNHYTFLTVQQNDKKLIKESEKKISKEIYTDIAIRELRYK